MIKVRSLPHNSWCLKLTVYILELFVISNRSKPWSYFRDVLISFFESAIVTSAILFPLKVVASLIGASIVYTLTTSDMPRRFSAKDHIQCSLGLVRQIYFDLDII